MTAYWSVVKTTAVAAGLIASVMLLASVDPALMALTLLAIPPFFFNGRGQRAVARARQAAAEPKRHEQHLHDLCTQSATLKEVMIAGNGEELNARADRRWEQAAQLEHRARLASVLWRSVGWAWFSAGFIGALTYVAWLVLHGRATVGDIVLVLTVAGSLQSQLSMTVVTASDVADAGDISANYLWLRRYADDQRPGARRAPESLRGGIDLRGVRFAYPGATREVLAGLDAHLPAGATIGLVGVNGAGKTTLVKLLTGMCRPTAGRIEVDGVDLADIDPHDWSRTLTGAFQDYSRFQFRAGESIGAGDIGRVDDTVAVSDAAAAAGADTVVDGLRDGLQTQLGAVFDGVDLSHGQWQKLAIARSYMRSSPTLLVLDEPTAALDPHAEQELFERFTAHARALGRTDGSIALMVSHRFSTIHMADLILVLADGAIVEQGTHQELMAAGGSYAELYRKQATAYADEKNNSGR